MYGEPGWLEATMEGSSEDDLERERESIESNIYMPCNDKNVSKDLSNFCHMSFPTIGLAQTNHGGTNGVFQ